MLKNKEQGKYDGRRKTPIEEFAANANKLNEDLLRFRRTLFIKEHSREYALIEAQTRLEAKAEAFEQDAQAFLRRLESNVDKAREKLSERLERYL